MACDGKIQPEEVEELKIMDKKTSYFEDVDLSKELEHLVAQFSSKGKKTIEELFEQLKDVELNTVQELLLLEVAMRIAYADDDFDPNEEKFIRFLRSKLKVHDETILDRFGKVDFLFDQDYRNEIIAEGPQANLLDSIIIPQIKELVSIDLTRSNG